MTNAVPVAPPGVDALARLLNDLSQTQTELLALLREKRERMSSRRIEEVDALQRREQELHERLQSCHERRAELLAEAGRSGLPCDSLAQLAQTLPSPEGAQLQARAKEVGGRMRLLQHQSLANWVLAQRALLHVSQLLEIIATGGRMRPTYGKGGGAAAPGGGLLNSEA